MVFCFKNVVKKLFKKTELSRTENPTVLQRDRHEPESGYGRYHVNIRISCACHDFVIVFPSSKDKKLEQS